MKHLCHALSFKKKKDQDLQKIYNTPSNSVIENFNKQVQTPLNESIETKNKKGQTRQYMCETTKVTCENCRNDSVVQKDIEDQVVKDVNDDFYQEKKKKESRSSSSSDDYEYPSKLDRTGFVYSFLTYIRVKFANFFSKHLTH